MWSMYFIGETLRIGGRTWSDYWRQLLVKILYYPMPEKESPDHIIYRTTKAHTRKRLIILGLMADSPKSTSAPNIDISGERITKMNMRK